MPKPSTVDAFLDLALQSKLLKQDAIDDFRCKLSADDASTSDVKAFAERIVRDGFLTDFQAENLLRGKWRGFLINDKYRLLCRLGAGGMGCVYLAEHTHMHRHVALKVLPAQYAKDAATLERFYMEARAAARLDHPHIVRAHDIDKQDDLHFLVLEYIDGVNLHDLVQRCGPVTFRRAAHFVRHAALGLQHAHEAGLVHRDLKPGNLLLDRSGVVKLLDLGLARFFHEKDNPLTRAQEVGNVLGTADFVAPEQVNDSRVDIRADIYSLGCTFYFLLVGKPPFHQGNNAQKLIWHQVRRPKSVRLSCPDVPEELEQTLNRMLAKKPDERFQTPVEIAEALNAWTQEPVQPPTDEEIPPRGAVRPLGMPLAGETPGSGTGLTPMSTSNNQHAFQLPRSGDDPSSVTSTSSRILPS